MTAASLTERKSVTTKGRAFRLWKLQSALITPVSENN
jgi:hypothetical protein